ncbi:metallophosphoesterase [Sanyastnella coralliicola]|uniref:metallophosphoesterase n=1 Tax=Sanyastnella coralliicola TaxID=3069118 RepID=UPI0027BAFA95|nr:metallophosphoesterase [Longitalea sp. SCSIO 12813]
MRGNVIGAILGFIIFIAVLVLVEIYGFKGIHVSLKDWTSIWRTVFYWIYWIITVFTFALTIMAMLNFRAWRTEHPQWLMFAMAAFMVLWAPKVILGAFHLIDDLRYLVQWGVKAFSGSSGEGLEGKGISRATFLTRIGQVTAGLTFVSFLYGVTKGRFAFRVLDHKVAMKNLPSAFDGMKVVQISDAHLGSFFEQFEDVRKGIKMINDLNPDLILFTGDLVNIESSEAEPWIPVFKELKAKYGKYSILGNHDYADYGNLTEEQVLFSRTRLPEIHQEMGFDLLLNENRILNVKGEKVALIGVENWGKGFKQQGDLAKAMVGTEDVPSRILMSHDPTHWEEQVNGKEEIQLTLSGHTHGMQMGIEIPSIGLKFSPARLRYKRWGGLYTEGEQHLHVNRGFGFLGFPGRVGMWPEITLLELQSA